MRLFCCMVIVAVVIEGAVIYELYDESTEDEFSEASVRSLSNDDTSNENVDDGRHTKSLALAYLPLTYHIPSSVPVQPLTYHVPRAVYNVLSPHSAPPRTPTSTVLLPMLGQTSAPVGRAGIEADVYMASARGNAFDTCVWLFEQCTGTNIPFRSSSYSMQDVTPGYLPHGFGPHPRVQYPVHVDPQDVVPTTYGATFWCGVFTMKCLPNINSLPKGVQNSIRDAMAPRP